MLIHSIKTKAKVYKKFKISPFSFEIRRSKSFDFFKQKANLLNSSSP